MNLLLPRHQHEALPQETPPMGNNLPADATHFGRVKIVTMREAVDELRAACREEGTPRIQAAIDRAEPWFDPIFTTGGE